MPTVEKAASEYTDYIKKRATVVGRREFSDSLFNSLVLQSSVGRGLGNTPEGPIPSGGDYGVLTGFNRNSVMTYPGFGISGDFTMECFFKSNDPASGNYEPICFFEDDGSSPFIGIVLDDGFICSHTSDGDQLPISQIEANTWYHVALTRSGTDFYTSINGQTSLNTDTIDTDISNVDFYVGWYGNTNNEVDDYFYSGSISNLRVSNYARYTDTDGYTLPTIPMQESETDLLLLLAKPSAPFADTALSRTPKVSTTTCGWAPGPIESPTTDYGVLTGFDVPDTVLWYPTFGDLGTNFTVEFFFKVGQIVDGEGLWYIRKDAGNLDYLGMYLDANTLTLDQNSDSTVSRYPTFATLSENTWYHVAVSREGSTWYTSVNGSTTEAFTADVPTLTSSSLCVGGYVPNNTTFADGSISNFRISSVAKYTDTNGYTLPIIPMQASATDLLLLLAKPSAPFADTVLSPRTPKEPTNTCKWGPGPIVAPITEYGLLTGFVDTPMYYSSIGVMPSTFTIEFFFKWNDNDSYLFAIGIPSGDDFSDYFSVYLNGSTSRVELESTFDFPNSTETGETNSNTWYHFALTRDGSDWYASINGSTEVWYITNTSSLDDVNLGLTIGAYFQNNGELDGSISNFRISNVAKYKTPGSYVVPSVPMEPATTDLLLLLAKPGESFVDSSSFDRTPTETCEWAPGEPIVV